MLFYRPVAASYYIHSQSHYTINTATIWAGRDIGSPEILLCTGQYGTVRCYVQFSVVQHWEVQYTAVQYIVQCSIMQCNTAVQFIAVYKVLYIAVKFKSG